jgi:PTS system mannose-specific IIC component
VTLELQLLLLAWGTFVGIDLVSVPQMMIARPLVAGAVAGAMLGDLSTGLQLGVMFELFQYDILPVGAVRYPEYGPATVAAVSAAHAVPGGLLVGIGLGTLVGLVVGLIGGVSLHLLRRLNARAVHRVAPLLEAGDARALLRLHLGSIVRDGVRALLVTAAGLGLAAVARIVLPGTLGPRDAILLAIGAVAAALAAGSAGSLRLIGRGPGLRWFAAGLGGGALVVWLR